MIPFTLSEICLVLNAEWIGPNRIIRTVSTNSSEITHDCLFVALEGRYFDGHSFVDQAVLMGACALLVNRYFLLVNIPQLVVKNTRLALSQLGFWVRTQVQSKVIAITGSSGKTTVKEMTASILGCKGTVIATHGNYNNSVGVPITLLRLTGKEDFIVLEVGASNFGDISKITHFVRPDIVLVNNIFSAHLSGLESLTGVAEAKGEIFSNVAVDGICILNADSHAWLLWKTLISSRSILSFSVRNPFGVDFFATHITCHRGYMRFYLHTPFGSSFVRLSMLGYHNVSNALAASALAFSVGATLEEVVLGLERMSALSGRLFPISLGPGKLLLDDSYNANVGSVLAAVQVLTQVQGYRVMVIGDIAELGDSMSFKYHRNLGELIAMTNINKVLSFGNFSYFISCYSGRGEHFYNKTTLIFRLMELCNANEVITLLVKGSRSLCMDTVIMKLREQMI